MHNIAFHQCGFTRVLRNLCTAEKILLGILDRAQKSVVRKTMTEEDFEKLRAAKLFSSLEDNVLRDIVGNEPPHLHPKGQMIFQQGDDADHFYVILSGWVKLFRQLPSGEEAILHIFTESETFAEAAMFNGHKYPATAEVVADARMIAINCNHFEKLLAENPRISMRMLAALSNHMKDLVTEVEQIKGRNSVQRFAFFLLKMCPGDAVSATVELPYEKSLIATRLGIQPESLSRILNKLRAYGVNGIKNKIIISNVEALRDLAMEDND
jgi:CRP-like cAMP-binding protein